MSYRAVGNPERDVPWVYEMFTAVRNGYAYAEHTWQTSMLAQWRLDIEQRLPDGLTPTGRWLADTIAHEFGGPWGPWLINIAPPRPPVPADPRRRGVYASTISHTPRKSR